MEKYVCIHGHFYQPPRENPWLDEVELQDSAYPYHDWNTKITEECYKQNAASRILGPDKKIIDISNNYSDISFDFGPTLLYWLEKHTPDIVILDIRLPDTSGAELLPEITARYPDTAVIMATAITETDTAINCLKKGAYDYIIKPFNLRYVVQAVYQTLEKKRHNLEKREYQQNLEKKVEEQSQKLHTAFLNSITALAHALEAKDAYTSGHSHKVSEMSVALAKELGFSRDATEQVRLAGLVHDIGKIGVRGAILNKPGKLTEEEYNHVKAHPEIGATILMPIIDDPNIIDMVRHHHEHYDGSGYPDGLQSKQIPLGARVLTVADIYDAMISNRPYRKAMSPRTACVEMEGHGADQLDPEIAKAFLKIVSRIAGRL